MRPVPMIPVKCAACGTPFLKRPCWVRKSKSHYCSRRCNGRHRVLAAIPKAHMGRSCWTDKSRESYRAKMSGTLNPAWKGGVTYRCRKGNYVQVRYVRCPPKLLPMARSDGYVMEHRLIVAVALGRLLRRLECVHHHNHNPLDNRIQNLSLFASNRDHKLYEAHGTPTPIWDGALIAAA